MASAALELVDAGLQLVSPGGQLARPSPGLALVEDDELLVGLDAKSCARLRPRRLHSRFWQDLGTAPLRRPFPSHLRTADLAHAHLKSVWDGVGGPRPEEVILAVPGTYSSDQLALLLGIAAAVEMPVRGLVDAAVAAAADRELKPHCLHLDLHLHRAVLTELENGAVLARGPIHTDPRVGLLGLQDAWARMIARTFVRATRFDPLHIAATEQILYAQLEDSVGAVTERESTTMSIASGGRQHTVELERERVLETAMPAYNVMVSLVIDKLHPDGTSLLLSHRIATLPGFRTFLEERTGSAAVVVHPASVGGGALAQANHIRSSGALPFVTRLPGYDARPPGPVTVPVTPPEGAQRLPPTHLVIEGVARRVGDEPLVIDATLPGGDAEGDHRPATVRRIAGQIVLEAPDEVPITINGRTIEGRTALLAGDRLRVGITGGEILVVTMVE